MLEGRILACTAQEGTLRALSKPPRFTPLISTARTFPNFSDRLEGLIERLSRKLPSLVTQVRYPHRSGSWKAGRYANTHQDNHRNRIPPDPARTELPASLVPPMRRRSRGHRARRGRSHLQPRSVCIRAVGQLTRTAPVRNSHRFHPHLPELPARSCAEDKNYLTQQLPVAAKHKETK
jgi:hypothetical protein